MTAKSKSDNEKRYKYVYQTKNLINGKTYIGFHCTDNLDDGYIGSGCRSQAYAKGAVKHGAKSSFLRSVLKYGYENFKKEILSFYESVEECLEEESFLVNEDWVKSNCNYNLKLGGLNTGFNLFETTKEQDELIFEEFMNGEYKEKLCKKYNISESVIWRITKDRDTSKRIIPIQRNSLFIKEWIENNSQYYVEKYKNWEMTKEEINKEIPFYLWKNDFLSNVVRNKRFVCEDINGNKILFTTAKELSDILGIKIDNSGFLPVTKGKYKQYKKYKFYNNDKRKE